MALDFYSIMKTGIVATTACFGAQVVTDKPEPTVIIDQYGEEQHIQDLSILENGIKRITRLIRDIDSKVVAELLYESQKKVVAVERDRRELVENDEDLQKAMDGLRVSRGGYTVRSGDPAPSVPPTALPPTDTELEGGPKKFGDFVDKISNL